MKMKISALLLMGAFAAAAMPAQASNREVNLPIESGLAYTKTGKTLDGSVKFYFGKQKHPQVLEKLGTYSTNKKTNAVGYSDSEACNRAFMSAMRALEQRANQLGANAVVNIVSNYKKNESSSESTFECHAGGVLAGVALKGDFVRIADK